MNDLDTGAELHALMDRALDDLDTPTDRLRNGSLQRGRVTRRRRRFAAGLGGAAAAVLITAVAVPALGGSDSTGGQVAHDTPAGPTGAALPSDTVLPSDTALPSGVPTPAGTDTPPGSYEPPAGWWDMPGRVMRDRLGDLLPDGLSITAADLGNTDLAPGQEPGGGWLMVEVSDGDAPAGGLNVLLYPPSDDGGAFVRQRTTCPGNTVSAESCTESTDQAGVVVGRDVRWVSRGGVVVLETTRLLPDGGIVYVATSNSSDEKWGAGSSIDREDPPATAGELRGIADASTWQDWQPRD